MSKITWDNETCGRCGGSGRYSFNLMHGSTCYGCGGVGKTLTALGKRQRAHWRDSLTVPARDVQPGWIVYESFNPGGRQRWWPVLAVQPAAGPDGKPDVMLRIAIGKRDSTPANQLGLHFDPASTLMAAPDIDAVQRAIALTLRALPTPTPANA